jgi:hypothetical protein
MKCEFGLLQTSDSSQTNWCQDWYKYLSLLHWQSQYSSGLVLEPRAASTSTVVSSFSTAHLEKCSEIYANVTIDKKD